MEKPRLPRISPKNLPNEAGCLCARLDGCGPRLVEPGQDDSKSFGERNRLWKIPKKVNNFKVTR